MTEHQKLIWSEVITLVILLFICTIPPLLTDMATRHTLMKEAFERGYAVQCVGKTGYHWECD